MCWKKLVASLNGSGTKIAAWHVEVASAHLVLWICIGLSTAAAKFIAQEAAILLFFGA
jgi:hypothetical protein